MKNTKSKNFSLRKFPYPYQAMFAISSDVDHALNLSSYLAFLKYLNTDQETIYGKGLDLEIGNSFWFYNGVGDGQLSYFKGLSVEETPFAEFCRDLWLSGHLDTLHSYGDFNRGGFERDLAERAVAELKKHNARIPVWINHGNDNNQQNVGNFEPYQGADPTSKAYHLDLLQETGTRFFWTGRSTHVAGQDASFSMGNQFQQKLQKLVLNTKYRKIQRPLPDPPNRLLIRTALADGRQVLDFQRFISRFGEVKNTDFHDLAVQLSESNLRSLIKSAGFMLLYTHMNEHLPDQGPLPEAVKRGFLRLKALQDKQELLVTTTSRLLQYADLIQHLSLNIETAAGLHQISLERDDHLPVHLENLMGLTLYCSVPENTELLINGESVAFQVNPPDATGKTSISIPWIPLEYPL